MMNIVLSFIFVAISPLFLLGNSSYQDASLKAIEGGRELYEVSFRSTNLRTCSINFVAQEKSRCIRINRLISKIKEIQNYEHFNQRVIDEPQYELLVGSKRFSVDFRAPEECETFSDGRILCAKVTLDHLQKLLLELRRHGRSRK